MELVLRCGSQISPKTAFKKQTNARQSIERKVFVAGMGERGRISGIATI